jgi:sugar O-acyltransferase (sialic acid O-acetyltransferase NeuD family)
MNKLLIYGAGGAGRELAFNLSLDSLWRVEGFIDDTAEKQGKIINGIPVLGNLVYLQNRVDMPNIAIAIVDKPTVKKKLIAKIKKTCFVQFPIVVVPNNLLSQYVTMDEGTLIAKPFNHMPSDTKIGKFVWVNTHNSIGHDSIIGDYTTIFTHISIGGSVEIGKNCVIGSGTTIRPHTKIGNNVIVGSGSVVVKDVPDNVVVVGNPATILKENRKD